MNASELIVAGLTFFSPALATTIEDKSNPVECLALNMYHEARGQGSAGLLGVSSVVLNRERQKVSQHDMRSYLSGPNKRELENSTNS